MAEGAAGQIGNDVDSGFEVGDTESDIGIDFVQLNFGGAGANGDANRFFSALWLPWTAALPIIDFP